MTTAIHSEMMQIAAKAAAYIAKLNGESETFEVEGDTRTAVVTYGAEIGEDMGDRWTAPSWWIDKEAIRVEVLADEGPDAECSEWLEQEIKNNI